MTKVSFGSGFWLITQVALLILHYGNIVQGLPWWVIWFPSLLILGAITIGLLITAIVIIAGVCL